MDDILNNSLCLTHGGTLSGLFGILASEKISSTNALEARGDRIYKFTDPERRFTEEDNYLFFESIMDRGRLNYASFVEPGNVGFAFLLVASGKSLLNQVDMAGNSDGVLLGRTDGSPLEVNLKEVDYKILIPDCYKEEVKAHCEKIKSFGHNPPEHLLEFRTMVELKQLMSHDYNEDPQLTQQIFCDNIGLNAACSDKNFNLNNKIVETKTSRINTSCSEALEPQHIEKTNLDSADSLIKHLKDRPTTANIQRNTLLLFNETVLDKVLAKKIYGISNGRPLVLDLLDKPNDLALALNLLGTNHYSVETLESGEKRMSSYKIREIVSDIRKHTNEEYIAEGMQKCLDIITTRDISPEECQNLLKKPEAVKEKEWCLGIDKVQYANHDTEEIKKLMEAYPDKLIEVWKAGMPTWSNIKSLETFNPNINKEWLVSIDKVTQNYQNTDEVKALLENNPDKEVQVYKAGVWKYAKYMELFTSSELSSPISSSSEDTREWLVAIDKVKQKYQSTEEVRELMKSQPDQKIQVWKGGMAEWKNVKEIPLFTPSCQENILNSISQFRDKLKDKNPQVNTTIKMQH